jgi:hypothetical protein
MGSAGALVCPLCRHAGDVDNDLEIFRSANTGEATLIDAQGNRVAVVGKPTQYGKMTIWDVSKVLLSGECALVTQLAGSGPLWIMRPAFLQSSLGPIT